MRERACPCRGATLQESIRGTHKTWADDGYCDRCRILNARVIAAVRSAGNGTHGDSSPTSIPFPATSRYATGLDAPAAPLRTSQVER